MIIIKDVTLAESKRKSTYISKHVDYTFVKWLD